MNLNIIFLQETHSQDNTIKSWIDNWKVKYSHTVTVMHKVNVS